MVHARTVAWSFVQTLSAPLWHASSVYLQWSWTSTSTNSSNLARYPTRVLTSPGTSMFCSSKKPQRCLFNAGAQILSINASCILAATVSKSEGQTSKEVPQGMLTRRSRSDENCECEKRSHGSSYPQSPASTSVQLVKALCHQPPLLPGIQRMYCS